MNRENTRLQCPIEAQPHLWHSQKRGTLQSSNTEAGEKGTGEEAIHTLSQISLNESPQISDHRLHKRESGDECLMSRPLQSPTLF